VEGVRVKGDESVSENGRVRGDSVRVVRLKNSMYWVAEYIT